MAQLISGRVMQTIIEACKLYLKDQFTRQWSIKEELLRLEKNHPKIKAVVSAYTKAQIKDSDDSLKSWIWQLRDAIDEAEDVLDYFEYMKIERHIKNKKLQMATSSLKKIGKRALFMDSDMKRLEAAMKKLDRVSAEVSTFLHLLEHSKQEQQEQEQQDQLCEYREIQCSHKHVLIGRGEEIDFVMKWLRKPTNDHPTPIASPSSCENISVLSVVGHGGMGKTALLRHIFQNLKEEFQVKMWVWVSKDFNARKVIAHILETFYDRKPDCDLLNVLQAKLTHLVASKRFLLVLDDVWVEDKKKWEHVLSPLVKGGLGSKILLTTRMDSVASGIADAIGKEKEVLKINGLDDDKCFELLSTHAFSSVQKPHKKLEDMARSIVNKLAGSPLAAKVIGGALNSRSNDRSWTTFLNSPHLLSLKPELGGTDILSILRLSFTSLPQHLKDCFAFCGIFPKNHKFDKDDVVRMWIALGLIGKSSSEGDTLEETGGDYFDDLVRKSFFDQYHDNIKMPFGSFGEFQCDEVIYYKMHDLLHDLAQFMSSEECFRFEGDNALGFRIPTNVRHLSVETRNPKVLRMIRDAKHIRSLFLISDMDDDQVFIEILAKIFEAFKSLRVLFIRSPCLQKMPETIKNLYLLRYLNLDARLRMMPISLSSLYHLRFIIYKARVSQEFCSKDFLPKNLSNLSLRHLELPSYVRVPQFEKLTSLQEVNEFNVKNKNGNKIGELEHMSQLQKLKIHFLENVPDAREAHTAKLSEKRKLTHLFLNWGNNIDVEWELRRGVGSRRKIVNSDLDLNVLENLEPFKNLQRLSIFSYKGMSSPKWMHNADLIYNLEYINLNGCSEWVTLPPFGQFPLLKSLSLCKMPKAKRLDYNLHGNDQVSVFPSLEVLNIQGLEELKDWLDEACVTAYDSLFPFLTELFLDNCPNLQELPYLPPMLKKMELQNIGWKNALNCKQVTHNAYLISNLEHISLSWCLEWETLPPFGQLPLLKSLHLCYMPNAKRLDHKFHGNDKVSVFPSLEVLTIKELPILEDWFDVAGAAAYNSFFPCLTELFLYNCPNLQELPCLPPKLNKMQMVNIQWKVLNCKQGTSKSVPVQILELRSCPKITSILALVGKTIHEDCPKLIITARQNVESGTEKSQLSLSQVVIDEPSTSRRKSF